MSFSFGCFVDASSLLDRSIDSSFAFTSIFLLIIFASCYGSVQKVLFYRLDSTLSVGRGAIE